MTGARNRKPPPTYDGRGCTQCGFLFVWDFPGDRGLYRAYHDEVVKGVRMPSSRTERVTATINDFEVLVVHPTAPEEQRTRAARIALVAHRDVPFDFTSYDGGSDDRSMSTHAFIARAANRAAALVIVRRRAGVQWSSWADWSAQPPRYVEIPDERWSVDFVWTRRDVRQHGLAARLIGEAASILRVQLADLAWNEPFTADGERFLRRLLPEGVFTT